MLPIIVKIIALKRVGAIVANQLVPVVVAVVAMTTVVNATQTQNGD